MGKDLRWARVLAPVVVAVAIGVPVGIAHAATAPVNTGLPLVTGTATVGQTLHTSNGTWSGSPTSYAIQWQRCVVGGSCSNISGQTTANHLIVSADQGKQLRSRVIAKNSVGSRTAYSKRTATVQAAATAPSNTVAPSFSGTLTDGQLLTADPGQWSGTAPITYTYQWQSSPDTVLADFVNIAATGQSYQLTSSDYNRYIRVVVTAHNPSTSTPSAPSAAQGPVAATPPTSNPPGPSISGAVQVDSILTVDPGPWTGTNLGAPVYAWYSCPAPGVSPPDGTCNGPLSTTNQYTTVDADQGTSLVVSVARTNDLTTTTAYTTPTAAVGPAAPLNTGQPTVSGTPQVGQTLTASNGTWAPGSGQPDYDPSTLTYQYQWLECDGVNCTPEPAGGDGSTYLVRTYDLGKTIEVSVTATDTSLQSGTAASQATPAITASATPVTVANWSMAEQSGTTMFDSSPYGNNGTLESVKLAQSDNKLNIAYEFGTLGTFPSRAVVPSPLGLDPGSQKLTVSLHVKYDVDPSAAVGDYDLIRKGLSDAGQDWKVEIMEDGTARCFATGATGSVDLRTGSTIGAGSWHTIVCTFSPTGATLKVDSGSTKSKSASVGTIANSSPLSIAAKVSGGSDDGGDQYTGKMDKVVVTIG
jgi:hypothetical protein